MGTKWSKISIFVRSVSAMLCIYLLVFSIGGGAGDNVVIEEPEVPLSSWSESEVFYRYDGEGYCYVITNEGTECFAFVDEDGTVLEAMSGGGTYASIDSVTWQYANAADVNGFADNGDNSVTVSYQMTDGSTACNTYRFYDNYVNVQASIEGVARSTTVAGAMLMRSFPNGYSSVEKKIASDWIYPENGDYPYLVQKGIVTSLLIGDHHRLYTFVRGTDGERTVLFEEYPDDNIPVVISGGTWEQYSVNYDLVFENLKENANADCDALFKGKNYDFSARVSEKTAKESAATIYYTDSVELGIDIKGLSDERSSAQVSYKVYDYDGNIVAAAEQNVALDGNTLTSVPVLVSTSKNGIFFLDYTVQAGTDTHRELYTFALLDRHNYGTDNPFGLSGVRFGQYEQNDTTAWILQNIGAQNVRVCISEPDYVSNDYSLLAKYFEKMTGNGIKVNGQYLLMDGWKAPSETTADAYVNEMNGALSQVGKYLTDCQVGNEYNLAYSGSSVADGMNAYLASYFDAGYRSIKENYGINIGGAGIALSHLNWMEQSTISGLFDKQDVFVTHAYGYPHSPDYIKDPSIEHSIESAYARTNIFLENQVEKTWYVGEVGYPTTALNTTGLFSGVDLRSQADYTIRECVLAVNYGADVVEVYNLYDQGNLFKGINAENQEDNFGLFYDQDYYGRIMPKPSAISFATMTRALDGIESCEEISLGSATARVFETSNEDAEKKVYVAWSNIARLSNDIGYEFVRTPNLPWNSQWKGSEQITIPVSGSKAVLCDSMGNRTELMIYDGQVIINVTGSPVFVEVTGVSENDVNTVSGGDILNQ